MLLRSLLFVPASRERMLEHARAARADAIVLDLEDAVAAGQKAAARKAAGRWVPELAGRRRRVFVRINHPSSGMARDDLLAVVGKRLAGVVVPKVDAPQDLRDLDVLLREAEMANGVRPGDIATIPIIESARGLLRCEEIVRATDRVVALSIGGEDYCADIGAPRSAEALQHVRAVVVTVAAAYRLLSIDSPFTDHRDADGLREDAEAARAIGLKGKYAIHPDQVPPLNAVFSPRDEEIAQARRIVEAYEEALRRDVGAVSVDGRMVDAPVAARARAVLELGEKGTKRGKG